MMLARSLSNSRTAGAIRTGLSSQKRVRFANDHPDLMKPRATDEFIFRKNGLISDFVHQKAEPVTQQRPRRLRFGKRRSLAEMAACCEHDDAPAPTNLDPCATEWTPRSIKVTAEVVNPADVLRNKVPASPAYTPMTAFSNGKKMWEQLEMGALNKATRAHYELIRERSQLVELLYRVPECKRDAELAKIIQIDQRIEQLKAEMNKRRQNMLCLQAF